MRVVWLATDPAALERRLRDTWGVALNTVGGLPAARFASGTILLAREAAPGDVAGGPIRLDPSLLVEPADPEAPVHPGGIVDLIGVGWATVDLDRAAREFAPLEFEPAAPDDLLGARARVARIDTGRLVLLEPATEGRLAATLARFGEGAAVVYLAAAANGLDPLVARVRRHGERGRIGDGPFGRSFAVRAGPWGPHLVVCESPDIAADPVEREAGTIGR